VADEVHSYAFWAPDLEDKERARRAVRAQQMICVLPTETYRRDMDIRNVRIYENNPAVTMFSFAGKYYEDTATMAMPAPEQSVNNKAKAAIDTFASQVFSTDQRARCLTVNGDIEQELRAIAFQEFCDGLAHELKLHKLRVRAGFDACILESGVGCIQFFTEDGKVKAERCIATEFGINIQDGLINGLPQTLYRHRAMARDKVLADLGTDERLKAAINAVEAVNVTGAPGDFIDVWEQWHLPTGKKTEDGWHVIAIEHEDGDLLVEKYEKPYFPVVFFMPEGRFTGAWGNSLMTQARPLQIRINVNEYRRERAYKLFHAGHLYIDRAAQMKKSELSNEIGSIWEGNGPNPPQQVLFNAVTAQFDAHIEADGNLIFANLGINVGASVGASQLGANAPAAAMREETAKSDQRLSLPQQNWEQFHLDCMAVAVDMVRDIVTGADKGEKKKQTSGYKVAGPGKYGLNVQDWRDVKMDEDQYILQIKAASPIPTDPDGLVALGERMVELQAWSPEELAGYMQDLDADSRLNRGESQRRSLQKMYESMLTKKKFAAVPDEFTDVKQAMKLGLDYLAKGKDLGVSEKYLERIRRYLKRLKANASPPPAPPAAPGTAAPPGAPTGPPQLQAVA
jgi:hypothetical protein